MDVVTLLQEFKKLGVSITLNADGNLIIKSQSGVIPERILNEIRSQKKRVVEFLSDHSIIEDHQILPVVPADTYATSSSQKRFYLLHQIDPESKAYNIFEAIRIKGEFNKGKLQESLEKLVARHELLRTSFLETNDGIVQRITKEIRPVIKEYQVNSEQAFNDILSTCRMSFQLSQAPLINVGLIKVSEDEAILFFELPHIICDATSMSILKNDFLQLYYDRPLRDIPVQYKDYVHWQNLLKRKDSFSKDTAYWSRVLSSPRPVLNLPTDYPRGRLLTFAGSSIYFELNEELYSSLKRHAASQGVTLYVMLLACFKILLQKYSGQDDIIVGSPVTNRSHPAIGDSIGIFINTVAIRSEVSPDKSFNQYLKELHEISLQSLMHLDLPFDDVIEELNIPRDYSRNLLFDVMFVMNSISTLTAGFNEMSTEPILTERLNSRYDLTLEVFEGSDNLICCFEFNTDLFKAQTIEQFKGHYLSLIDFLLHSKPEILINDIEIISERERIELLNTFNQTAVTSNQDLLIHEFFESQVLLTPNQTAISFAGQSLTFIELNERSNNLAWRLKEKVQPGEIIGLHAGRSPELIIGILAILKSGGAYLPLDPIYPEARLETILAESKIKLLLSEKKWKGRFGNKYDQIFIDDDFESASDKAENLPKNATSSDLAYVIFTSGSTGKPKGVMIEHKSVVNFFLGMKQVIPITTDDAVLAITSVSFDISVLELLFTLCNGIEVVLNPSAKLGALDSYLEEKAVDFSLFFFSSYGQSKEGKYDLLLKSAAYADENGFKAIWTPERHFHEFGGLFPNPSILSAALAMTTKKIQIRSGSVVAPLHDPIRISEEWSVVDNLSNGRVGISFASGWNPNDFVLSPDSYKTRHVKMYESIEAIQKLWRGGTLEKYNGLGNVVDVSIFPRPIQKELPMWITSAGNRETFYTAGSLGLNILTHFLGQELDALAKNIKVYKEARKEHGHDPDAGIVTLMVHTFVGADIEEVERTVKGPMIEYLKSSIGLNKILLGEAGVEEDEISEELKEIFLDNAFKRYNENNSLIGTLETCERMIRKLKRIGVSEFACLVDFGVEESKVLKGLEHLSVLRDIFSKEQSSAKKITILQTTPSFLKLAMADADSKLFLKSLKKLLIGGESFPPELLMQIRKELPAELYNMYGPTETTIWSTVYKLPTVGDGISIGKPIANTAIYILDQQMRIVPKGIVGDIYIGGAGLSRGYLHQKELTSSRFLLNPFKAGEKIYKTGDVGRWRSDGNIDCLGRVDLQIKIGGYRIELEDIEQNLLAHEEVTAAVADYKERDGDKYLVGYVITKKPVPSQQIVDFLLMRLPNYMVPSYIISMDQFPLTSNGKLDRKALPLQPNIEIDSTIDLVGPKSETEAVLINICREILGIQNISINDNFFRIGGNSLKTAVLINKVNLRLMKDISIGAIFKYPILRDLAGILEGNKQVSVSPISLVEKMPYYHASPVQRQLYIINNLQGADVAYNVFTTFHLIGTMDVARFYASVSQLVKRHDSLRTYFGVEQGEVVQFILNEVSFKIDYFNSTLSQLSS